MASALPQWDLAAVLCYYEGIDHDTCHPRLLLLKALCLTALGSGNRCSELDHLSRQAIVDQGFSITLPLMERSRTKNTRPFPSAYCFSEPSRVCCLPSCDPSRLFALVRYLEPTGFCVCKSFVTRFIGRLPPQLLGGPGCPCGRCRWFRGTSPDMRKFAFSVNLGPLDRSVSLSRGKDNCVTNLSVPAKELKGSSPLYSLVDRLAHFQ